MITLIGETFKAERVVIETRQPSWPAWAEEVTISRLYSEGELVFWLPWDADDLQRLIGVDYE